mmetsp:Transcript_25634/g.102189  ORF Transcript_25634/g.102189 Transcript_25634/m.102189 type:complete len:342 (-) Transcript_25634:565-1590(-)
MAPRRTTKRSTAFRRTTVSTRSNARRRGDSPRVRYGDTTVSTVVIVLLLSDGAASDPGDEVVSSSTEASTVATVALSSPCCPSPWCLDDVLMALVSCRRAPARSAKAPARPAAMTATVARRTRRRRASRARGVTSRFSQMRSAGDGATDGGPVIAVSCGGSVTSSSSWGSSTSVYPPSRRRRRRRQNNHDRSEVREKNRRRRARALSSALAARCAESGVSKMTKAATARPRVPRVNAASSSAAVRSRRRLRWATRDSTLDMTDSDAFSDCASNRFAASSRAIVSTALSSAGVTAWCTATRSIRGGWPPFVKTSVLSAKVLRRSARTEDAVAVGATSRNMSA